MDNSIHLLHVEDAPDFAALTADILEQDDRFTVRTERDPREALEWVSANHNRTDCIVSDYEMPYMTGIEFLKELNAQCPNYRSPFILFTGKGSEEVAADALNAGASSYIQKSSTDTFAYLRSRIIGDVQAAHAQRDSRRFGALTQLIDDPVYVVDERGQFVYVNGAFTELVGYDRSEIIGADPSLIKPGESVTTANNHLRQILSSEGSETVTFEIDITTKNGRTVRCEDQMSVLPYDGDRFQSLIGILREIS